MKFKASTWNLSAAMLFSILAVYYFIRHSEDLIGITLFSLAAIIYYIAAYGNWKNNN